MRDAKDLLEIIKKAALDAAEATHPADFCFGKVTSEKPLKIMVEQKMTLGEAQLVLTRNVTDFETKVTVDNINVYHTSKSSPVKTWMDEQKVKIHNSLKTGEEVILIKQKGGQKYLVLDRVVKT